MIIKNTLSKIKQKIFTKKINLSLSFIEIEDRQNSTKMTPKKYHVL